MAKRNGQELKNRIQNNPSKKVTYLVRMERLLRNGFGNSLAGEIKMSGVFVTKVHRCSTRTWLWNVQKRKVQSEVFERFTK